MDNICLSLVPHLKILHY